MPKPDPTPGDRRGPEAKRSGFTLRLDAGRVFLEASGDRAPALGFGRIEELSLEVPDVTFPFDVTGGSDRFKSRRCTLHRLELALGAPELAQRLGALVPPGGSLRELAAEPGDGHLELAGRVRVGAADGAFSAKLGVVPEGERLRAVLYDVRLHGAGPLPAAVVEGELLNLAVGALGGRRDGPSIVIEPLPRALRRALPPRGFKLPDASRARLAVAELGPDGLRLLFESGAGAPSAPADADLLSAVEGTRAFAEAEGLLARGDIAGARAAYLAMGDAAAAHPFAAYRLLSLLCADEHAHDEALDLARSWRTRRADFPPAIWVIAQVALARGDRRGGAQALLSLAESSRVRGERLAAAAAALAAGEAAREVDPALAVRALSLVLALRREHPAALKLLAEVAPAAGDLEAALTANRRLAASSREPGEVARAHVRLAKLAGHDLAEAKLHYDHALRLFPDDREALEGLAAACRASGEALRATRTLARVGELAAAAGDRATAGRIALEVGRSWEEELSHDENALLRFREATQLLPDEAEPHFRAARLAQRLGRWTEAAEHHRAFLDRVDPPTGDDERAKAAAAHLALATIARERTLDEAAAVGHLEAAVELGAPALEPLLALVGLHRAAGRSDALAAALERAAPLVEEPARRGDLLAEAAQLTAQAGDLSRAERLFARVVEENPERIPEWEALVVLRKALADPGGAAEALGRLADLAPDAESRARALRRLGTAARDHLGDLDRAATAFSASLRAKPDDVHVHRDLVDVLRRRDRPDELAAALGDLADACREAEPAAAAAALAERATILEQVLQWPEDAAADLARARALTPEDPELLARLGRLQLALGRGREAKETLAAAVAVHGGDADAPLLADLGRGCEAAGDPEGAAEAYLRALGQSAADDELGARLDALLVRLDRPEARARALRVRARRVADLGRTAAAAELLARAAELHRELGAPADAAVALAEALALAPDHDEAATWLSARAELLESAGERLEAARVLIRLAGALRDGPAAARRLVRAAELFGDDDREGRARALDEAVERHPANARARAARAAIPGREPRAVLDDLEQALAVPLLDGDGPGALERPGLHRAAAVAARFAGELSAARRHLELYVAHRPGDVDAVDELAGLLRADGQSSALLDLLLHRVEISDGEGRLEALRSAAALAANDCGEPEVARSLLRRARELGGRDPRVLRPLLGLLDGPPASAERASVLSDLAAVTAEPAAAAALRRRQAEELAAAGQAQAALAPARVAAALAPDAALHLELLLALAQAAGDDAMARDVLGRRAELAARRRDADAAERLGELAAALDRAGDAGWALRVRRRALDHAPAPALASDLLGAVADAEEAAGRTREAARALLERARLLPAAARIRDHLRRTLLLERAGDLASAREALDAALALAPRDRGLLAEDRRLAFAAGDAAGEADALEALGNVAAAEGDAEAAHGFFRALAHVAAGPLASADRAEAALRRALAHRPDDRDAASRLADLLFARGGSRLPEAVRLARRLAATQEPAAAAARSLLQLAAIARDRFEDPELQLALLRDAAARCPDLPAARLALARELSLQGGRQEALVALRGALDGDPGDEPDRRRELLRLHADLAADAGDAAAAEQSLREILAERPWDEGAAGALAAVLAPRDAGRAQEVLAGLASVLSDGGRRRSLRLQLAEQALAAGDAAAATAHLADARRLAPDPLEHDLATAGLARRLGHAALLGSALERAVPALLRAGRTADAAAALEELASLHAGRGDVAAAVEALARSEAIRADEDPKAGAACARRRAELLAGAGDPAGAELAWRRAFELDPGDLAALRAAAELCRAAGDAAGEADLVEASLALLPDGAGRARAVLRLAELFLGPLESPTRGEHALLKALELDPGLAAAETMLQTHYERHERRGDLARRLVLQANPLPPDEAAVLLARAAELRETTGDLAGAADAASRAADLVPQDAVLARRASDRAAAVGREDEAVARLHSLLALHPDDAGAEEALRAHLHRRGDLPALAALEERRAARVAGGRRAGPLLAAARLHRQSGDDAAARRCEDAAFDDDPADDAAFAAVVGRTGEPVRLAEVLERRARVVPREALALQRARGEALAAAGYAGEALAALEAALVAGPDDLPTLVALADLAADQRGDAAASAADLRIVALAEGGFPAAAGPAARARYRLALDRAASSPAEAVPLLERALAAAPDHPRAGAALLALDRALAGGGDLRRLHEVRLELAARAAAGEPHETWLAAAAEAAPDAASRLAALRRLAQLRPEDRELRESVLEALERAGPAHAAERCQALEHAAADLAGLARARRLLVAAQLAGAQLADPARALKLRTTALAAAPDEPEVLRACLADLRDSGDAEVLAYALSRLLPLARDDAERGALRLDRARALLRARDPAAAAAFEEIVRSGPRAEGFAEAAYEARRLHLDAGRPVAAAAILEAQAAAAEDPRRKASLLVAAARILDEGVRDVDGAARLLEGAAVAVPADIGPRSALVALYERAGRPRDAAAWLDHEARLLTDPGARAERHLRRARLLDAAGDAGAAEAYRRVLADRPGDVAAHRALAAIAAAAGDAEAELAHVRALLERRPELGADEAGELVRREARLLAATSRDAEAAAAWGAIARRSPDDDEAWTYLRPHLAARKAWPELLELIDRRDAALAPAGDRRRGERRDLRLERARIFAFELGRASDAEGAYRLALELDPKNRGALAALRELVERRGDVGATIAALEDELACEPLPPPALLAGLHLKLARLKETALVEPAGAVEAYLRGRDVARAAGAPALLAEAERGLVRTALAAGRPADALEAARSRLADPAEAAHPALRRLAAEAALALGDRADAKAHLEAALAASPGDEDILSRLEALASEQGPESHAAAMERRAAAGPDPARRAELLLRAADLRLRELEDEIGAERDLRAALEALPSSDAAFERLRDLLSNERRHEELLELHRLRAQGAERAGDRARALLEQGLLLAGPLGRSEAAAEALERALAAEPGLVAAADALAGVHVAAGHDDLAEPLLRRVLDAGGDRSERDAALRLAALLERGDRDDEALDLLKRAARVDPSSAAAHEAAARVAERLERWDEARAATGALLQLHDPHAAPAATAALHRRLAALHRRLCDHAAAARELGAALSLEPDDRESLRALVELQRESAPAAAARALARLLEGAAAGPERGALLRDLGTLQLALGDVEAAVGALEGARAELPDDIEVLGRLAEVYARARRHRELVEVASALARAGGGAVLEPLRAQLGRSHRELGDAEAAYAQLEAAARANPDDTALALELRDLALALGRLDAYARLEREAAEREAAREPVRAAARLRALAAVAVERLADAALAAALLERAVALAPADEEYRRALLDLQSGRPESAGAAAAGWAVLARAQPHDPASVRGLARACRVAGDAERARLLEGLADGLAGPLPSPPGAVPKDLAGARLAPALRERLAHPGAAGALPRLIRALAGPLESLFPSSLATLGASPSDRVSPAHAPQLHARVTAIAGYLLDREVATYLAPGGGVDAVPENTSPPALVVGLKALTVLPPAGVVFLLARGLELASAGAGLLGKFPPADLVTLGALACRVFFPDQDVPGLPAPRLKLYLDALDRLVPRPRRAQLQPLAEQAREELSRLDPRELLAGVRCTASRLALLASGHAGAALDVLLRLDRRYAGRDPSTVDRAAAISGNAELADLVELALRDDWTELRREAGLVP